MIIKMLDPQSTSEEAQKILETMLPFDYPEKGCSGSRTPGQICGACLRLQTIDAKLAVQLENLMNLLLIRIEVKEHLNQNHDPLTSQLPAEVTSHIFSIYTEDFNSNFDPHNPFIEHGGPLLLAAVSKSWREIAFGTPHLWNTVNINISSTYDISPQAELIKQWLDRSRHLPLYLSLIDSSSGVGQHWREPEPDSFMPVFNVLQNVAPRWCKLTLGFCAILYPAFLGKVTCTPTLDTLKLFNHNSVEKEFHLPHTPSLKHLDISGILFSNISIDWSNLTTLNAGCINVDEFFEVLRRVEGLDSFRVGRLLSDARKYPLPTTPLMHSTLMQLYLNTSGIFSNSLDIDLETLLNLAIFPSLEKFGYTSSGSRFFPNRAVASLFNRSRCQLTHFDLSGNFPEVTSDHFISIVSDLPTITHLILEDTYNRSLEDAIMSDEFLQRITPTLCGDVAHTRLLPCLESLEFLGHKIFSWSCLANLVSTTTISDSDPYLSQGQSNTTNSIRRILFRLFYGPGTASIDANSIILFESAQDAGISINIVNEAPPQRQSPPVVIRFPFDVLP